MRFWISHASDVPIREQLVTQIVLAILSEDLQTGVRLPSTRELARRFRIHANTVSAAYKDLERAGWLELRQVAAFTFAGSISRNRCRPNWYSTARLPACSASHGNQVSPLPWFAGGCGTGSISSRPIIFC